MLVRFRGDADDQPNELPLVPFHAVRHLDNRNTRLMNQLPVFLHAVRNGNAVAEVSVRLLFPAEHALDVARGDIAGLDQDAAGRADRFFFVFRADAKANTGRSELDHGAVKWSASR